MATLNGYKVRKPWLKLSIDEVPVFEAADMCKGEAHRGVRHCAIGWRVVLGLDQDEFRTAYRRANNLHATACTIDHNDRLPTDAARAVAMNRTMLLLGFGNVEEFEYA